MTGQQLERLRRYAKAQGLDHAYVGSWTVPISRVVSVNTFWWKYLDSKLILETFSFPLSIANHGEINSR